MSKYTEEFRRDAIELMKKVGITKASRELHIAHCTLYRWCRELEGNASEQEESDNTDLDSLMEHTSSESEAGEPTIPASDEAAETGDTIATAMAMLVIENTHLREVIQHLRETISGLTDHRLY